jgi:oxalate decarboxylase
VSLNQWLALTPPELLQVHLKLGNEFTDELRKTKAPIVPA